MKFDVVCSLPHYRDHVLPIFEALPSSMQGTVHPLRFPVEPPMRHRVALVGGWQDVQPLRGRCRMVYVEHGAGQSYGGDVKSAMLDGYSGGHGGFRHTGVEGFICPNETVAARWKSAPAIAVGSPKMDQYVGRYAEVEHSVCFIWHWPCQLAPETRTALPHYQDRLPEIVSRFRQQGFVVFGHAHPRWDGKIDGLMADAGMKVLETDREVFRLARIMVVDNSSLGVEHMALGRPVVWMNAPWYRRDIHHGGRFWDWTAGQPTVDGPGDLLALNLWDVVARTVPGTKDTFLHANRIADSVYAYRDGSSSRRAAEFLARLFEGQ